MCGRRRVHRLLGSSYEGGAQNERRGDEEQCRDEHQPQTAAGERATALSRLPRCVRAQLRPYEICATRGCRVDPGGCRGQDAWEVPSRQRRVDVQGSVGGVLRVLRRTEQRCEVERSVRIAPLVGALEGRLRTTDITVLGQDRAKIARCCGMPPLIGEAVGTHRAVDITVFVEEHAEVERAIGVATLLGTAICRLCAGNVAAALQQHSKIDRCRGMTP